MNTTHLRFIFFLVLLLHGIGHYMGVISALGMKLSKSSSFKSWAFRDTPARGICFMIYLVPFFGFIGAALSIQEWVLPSYLWTNLALFSAIISTLGIVFFWNALAVLLNKIGALLVNIYIVITILWLHWPQEISFA